MHLSQYDLNRIKSHKFSFKGNKLYKKKDIPILKKLYFFMLRLRMIEQALADEYHPADEIKCPVHFCIGQESIPAALSEVIKKNDQLFCHHRSHGYFLAKKAPTKAMFAELYGKIDGSNKGFAGSQDISFSKENFYAGAILAGSIGIAVGNSLAQKINSSSNIVYACFGESATDQGIFWESVNYAALNKLPIVFICENNNYSVFSPQRKRQSGKSISEKAKDFGVKSIQINGNDTFYAFRTLNKITNDIRKHNKPFLIEAFTSRWSSHYGPEDDSNIGYRDKNDLNFWKKNCPIKNIEKLNILNLSEIRKYQESIKIEIKNLFKFAKKSKFIENVKFDEFNYSKPDYISKIKDANDLIKKKKHSENIFFQPKGY
jgi:pyruvate dehydrogenase E1 component alpha subunit